MNSVTRNSYVHLGSAGEPELELIDVFVPKMYKWGRDFYISVFRHIEKDTNLSGFTFVIRLDEDFAYRDYFNNIHYIIRCFRHKTSVSGWISIEQVTCNRFLSLPLQAIAA